MQDQLSKKENVEFIKKIKYTLPSLVKQLHRFLSAFSQMVHLNEQQKRDLADYLVPEIDTLVNFLIEFIERSQKVIERLTSIKAYENDKRKLDLIDFSDDGNGDRDDNDDDEHHQNNNDNEPSKKKKLKKKLEESIALFVYRKELDRLQKISDKFKKNFPKIEQKL
jgi:hypothetical protein